MAKKKKGEWRTSTKCKNCNGTGKIEQEEITNSSKGSNVSVLKLECPVCKGDGWFSKSGKL